MWESTAPEACTRVRTITAAKPCSANRHAQLSAQLRIARSLQFTYLARAPHWPIPLKEARLVSLLSSRVGLFDRSLRLGKQKRLNPSLTNAMASSSAVGVGSAPTTTAPDMMVFRVVKVVKPKPVTNLFYRFARLPEEPLLICQDISGFF